LVNPLTPEILKIHNTPNLGLGYLATALRRNEFQVEICDGMKKGMTKKKLVERLKVLDYDVAGFQVCTCAVKETRNISKMIISDNPRVITVIGGPHPSGDPEGALTDIKEADFAFRGEGEVGLPKLLKKLNEEDVECQFEDIPNLIWRENGKVRCNPLQPIEDLDSLGMPSWDLINPKYYPNAPIGALAKNFPLTTISCSRGCVHHCTYCANTRIMGKNLRVRSAESVLEEMQHLYNNYGIRELQIIDDCFTSNRSLAVSVCKGIIERGLKISLSFPNGVRIETLDEELLILLEKAGCYSLGMAIESGSQRIINHMKRGQTLEMVKEKVELVRRVTKIRMSGFFIIGYPEEEEQDILETIRLSKELPFSRANFTLWMPVPGSEMTEKLKKEGKLENVDSNKVLINKISYVSENLTRKQLEKLIVKAYRTFYLRPRIFFGLLLEIKSWEQLKFILRRVEGFFYVSSK
jgi:radical SAM superfamily enzyme YgiQ (UPF0313 family)